MTNKLFNDYIIHRAMSEKKGPKENESEGSGEKLSKFARNFNALGAVALGAAGIVVGSGILMGLAAINAGQAGFFEMTRRGAKRSRLRKRQS